MDTLNFRNFALVKRKYNQLRMNLPQKQLCYQSAALGKQGKRKSYVYHYFRWWRPLIKKFSAETKKLIQLRQYCRIVRGKQKESSCIDPFDHIPSFIMPLILQLSHVSLFSHKYFQRNCSVVNLDEWKNVCGFAFLVEMFGS